jgi:ubiquinone/menaquinone biosynthesis C-methylase UbiE
MTMQPDFGATALDYARHRAGFPDSLFERLKPFGVGEAGQSVVDLGTGTGTLARGFARRGCRVLGVDIADRLLEQARALDAAEGLEVEYRIARAERTGLPERCAEVVSAGQCWHWFDRAAVAAEAARILMPRGTVVIAYFDWLPLPATSSSRQNRSSRGKTRPGSSQADSVCTRDAFAISGKPDSGRSRAFLTTSRSRTRTKGGEGVSGQAPA